MDFEYISAKEAAMQIGVTERWIQQLCKDGKVDGAKRFGTQGIWLVPLKWVNEKIESQNVTEK
jgi:hypothetical protein